MDAQKSPDFHFYADFEKKEVLDNSGRLVGTIHDIALSLEPFPRATHLILRKGLIKRRYAVVPWEKIERILLTIHLQFSREEIPFMDGAPSFEFTLVRDILDQQVVDTNGQKVIRVNDAHLIQVERDIRIVHVDVGIRGIVRRLGWQWWVDPFVEIFLARTDYLKDNLINWRYIQPLAIHPQKGTLKLTLDQKQLATIPSPDISELMQKMDAHQRLALFKSIAPDWRPGVFSNFDLLLQKELLENMDLKEAAELLSKAPADQTTDLLEEIPKSVADSLLALMETTKARRLSALLGYTSDSAGGLMTTEMITAPHTATVADIVERLRPLKDQLETMDFVYLVEGESRLVGQVLLRRLLLASPAEAASQYAYPRPIYARAKDSLREVAFLMEKYRLASIPVVNNGKERYLQGVITIDDILERIIPFAWKRRAKMTTP
ncbi:MAG: CBS domain-containing protein [Elusimicrobia bacterium]|nr:CBS domain-containing protein [Elusimicrobiota bacterium]